MVKKRNPREIIQGVSNPRIEHAYVKFPGREMIDVSLRDSEKQKSVNLDLEKIKSLAKECGIQRYSDLHTHSEGDSIPSANDIYSFLKSPDIKTMIIASQNPKTGELEGYYFLRKRDKASPEHTELKMLEEKDKKAYEKLKALYEKGWKDYELKAQKRNHSWITKAWGKLGIDISLKPISDKHKEDSLNCRYLFGHLPDKDPNIQIERDIEWYARNMMANRMCIGMEDLAAKYNLQYKFVPEKGYFFNQGSLRFEKKKLEQIVSTVVAVGGFLGSLFFLGSNVTGNAIGNLSKNSGSGIGIILFLIGLAGVFFYFRKK